MIQFNFPTFTKLLEASPEELGKKLKIESYRLLFGLCVAPIFAFAAIIMDQPVALLSAIFLLSLCVWGGHKIQAIRTAYWLKLRE